METLHLAKLRSGTANNARKERHENLESPHPAKLHSGMDRSRRQEGDTREPRISAPAKLRSGTAINAHGWDTATGRRDTRT